MRLSADFIGNMGQGQAPAGVQDAGGVSFHSGRIKAGDAFFALPGEQGHGITFADAALANGAAFIVSDKPHPQGVLVADPAETLLALGRWARQQHSAAIIGVTGSAGKTSTKTFVAAALNASSSPGNFNTPLALAKTLVETVLSGQSNEPLVLELGIDHIGEMARLVELVKPTHGILTAIAPSHLEGLGTLETVAQEKTKLLAASPFALASLDASPHVALAHKTYGLSEAADFAGSFDTQLSYKGVHLTPPAPGRTMALNALAALVLAEEFGIDMTVAARRIESSVLEPGRLAIKVLGDLTILDDSYNSNPASAKQALEILRTLPAPRTAVLGDMLELGAASDDYHLQLGQQTTDIDRVIAIGPHARNIAAGNPRARYFGSTDAALQALAMLPRHGSILFKASRGMRFETLVAAMSKVSVGQ